MSTTPEAQRLEEWLSQFDEAEQERIIQHALDHMLPNLKSRRLRAQPPAPPAQPTKLSIQSLWPFQPGGGIDPRSELARSTPLTEPSATGTLPPHETPTS